MWYADMAWYQKEDILVSNNRENPGIIRKESNNMLFLSSASTTQGDPVALLMVLVLAVIVAVMAVRKQLRRKHPVQSAPAAAPTAAAAAVPETVTAPGSAGKLKLHDVEPKTAAMLMAITADKLGKPLNELRFLSIKEVKK